MLRLVALFSGAAVAIGVVYPVSTTGGLGRRFDGIGALSGGGGTSIFLRDYPEPSRSTILDLLFKPSYGASLHILKAEIGGDAQSTEAVEPSHMHSPDDFSMERGYEGWLLAEAKARNPSLKTYGLAWAYPGWVGNGTGSPYGAPGLSTHYLTRWVAGMRDTWNVTIDYLGQWNEKPPSVDFILALRAALDDAGLASTGLVGSDENWDLADAINNSSALRSALVALGAHYPASSSTPAALATGLPLWASEDFSNYNRGGSHWGAQCWVRTLNHNFVNGNITAGIMWHMASAMDERQWWYGASALNAPQPWSGFYEATSTLWAFAHTTQFSAPGWHYLRHGSGSGNLSAGGTYVSLTDSQQQQLTIVVEKVAWAASTCLHNGPPYDTAAEEVSFALGGGFAGLTVLQAWWTHYPSGGGADPDGLPTVIFEQQEPLAVVAGVVSLRVRVGDVWTLSTVTTAAKAALPAPPPPAPFPTPYFSDFSEATPPRPPRLWSDQGGVFEAFASGDPAHGTTLRQSVPAHPICWAPGGKPSSPGTPARLRETQDGIVPHTLLGEGGGGDPAAGTPGAFVGARASGNINRMAGFFVAVNASGFWNASLGTQGIALGGGQLASGTCAPAPPGTWHTLTLNVSGGTAAAALDGQPLFQGLDVTGGGVGASRAGWAALGTTDWGPVQFDDVHVAGVDTGGFGCDPATAPPLAPLANLSVWRCADSAAALHGSFDWLLAPGGAMQNATPYGAPGRFALRSGSSSSGGGGGGGSRLCLSKAVTRALTVQLVECQDGAATPPDVRQLWVVRPDNQIMSLVPWQPQGACLAMGGDTWSFGVGAEAGINNCGALSSVLVNYDPVSGRLSSEWLPDLCFALCASAAPGAGASPVSAAAMGSLLPHTQGLQQPQGLCLPDRCEPAGLTPTAAACSSLCDATPWCSSMTWAGPGNDCCHNECYLRFDGLFEPATCGQCDQTAANKTSGWVPGGGPHPPPPPPSCATNGHPCPPPSWPPEWNLTRSTVVQPWCRDTFTPAHPWGLISLAWDCSEDGFEEAATLANCTALKASGIATRCFTYDNAELSLRWLESQRAAMDDPSRASWFLRWPNGTLYTEPETSRPHGGYEAQGFWDFRVAAASEYFVSSILAKLDTPAIDGTYADDVTGIPQEHPLIIPRLNLSAADVQALQFATQATNMALINASVRAGKYVWQAFGAGDGAKAGPTPTTCAAWMRDHCAPTRQGEALLQQHDAAFANQSVAAFLIVRPPTGYLGWGWYSNDKNWSPIFLLQAGTPRGLCKEGPSGVFSREWSAGTAVLDCNSWIADLPFPSLPVTEGH